IISGRLRGLWGQFLPAFGLLVGLWLYFASILPGASQGDAIFLHLMVFLSLPVIGLYFSLRCRNFISAFVATLAMGLFGPVFLPELVAATLHARTEDGFLGQSTLLELLLGVVFLMALHGRLRARRFPLARSES